jgi:hypothetical protein
VLLQLPASKIEQLAQLKSIGALEPVNPELEPDATIVVRCGDGHCITDMVNWHGQYVRGCMSNVTPPGGALMLSPLFVKGLSDFDRKMSNAPDSTAWMVMQYLSKKPCDKIIVEGHAPCGMAEFRHFSIIEKCRLIIDAKHYLRRFLEEHWAKPFPKIATYIHIRYPDLRMRTKRINHHHPIFANGVQSDEVQAA